MSDKDTIERFMRAVVPWPVGDTLTGYVNLHYDMPPDPKYKGKSGVPGWAFQTVERFAEMAEYAKGQQRYLNFWFCTSLQRENGGANKSGHNYKAKRLAANALQLKSLFVDLDLDPNDPKKYPDEATAKNELGSFLTKHGLPRPSAIVRTGNGLHLYWCSDKPIDVFDWKPLAEGLKALLAAEGIKFDPSVPADPSRLLRLPTSFNRKDPNNPKPVVLLTQNIAEYDFSTKPFQDLATHYNPAAVAAASPKTSQSDVFDAAAFAGARPNAAFKGRVNLDDKLSAGCEKIIDPRPIFAKSGGCPMYRAALETGGAGLSQGLWMLQVLGTTFMEQGNEFAHAISEKHATYAPDNTDEMYRRKVAERNSIGLGYPSCASFKSAGSEACAGCPLLSKGKSPLNIEPKAVGALAAVTVPVIPGSGNVGRIAEILGVPDDVHVWMPYECGYDIDDNDIICKVIPKHDKKGNELPPDLLPLFRCVTGGYWLSKGGQGVETVHLVASADKGCTVQADAPITEMSKREFRNFLNHQRVLVNPRASAWTEDFFVSVMEKLRKAAEATTTVPYGWYYDNQNARRGFVYAGKVYLDDGSDRPAGSTDPAILRNYTPVGRYENWLKVAECVTARKRPELTVILLLSFMSPLLELVGRSTVVMSAHGLESGGGKSSAYAAGMSVWGHPVKTKGTEDQTKNNITTIMKTIRNLPFYMDEITDDKHREMFRKVFHEADGGKEKGRNVDGRRVQDVGTWSLAMHYASNNSLVSFLRKHDEHSVYSVSRVLEFEVRRVEGGPGWMPDAEATALVASAERNYGHMGMKYARYLADNHKVITADCVAKVNEMQKVLEGGNTERYWYTGVGLMVQAAKYARELGLDVDPAEIEQFMIQVYRQNRQRRDEFFGTGLVDKSEDALTRYLQEREAQERGLWTDQIAIGRGRSKVQVVNVLKGPTQAKNTDPVSFRFAVEQHLLIIAVADFDAWRKANNIPDAVIDKFKTTYGASYRKWAHLKGWKQDAGRQMCLVLHVSPTTPLWDYMMSPIADAAERLRLTGVTPPALPAVEDDAA